jgi:hypothetical protein
MCFTIQSFNSIVNAANFTITNTNRIVVICNNIAKKKGIRNRISITIFNLLSFISVPYFTGGLQSNLPNMIPPIIENTQNTITINIKLPIIIYIPFTFFWHNTNYNTFYLYTLQEDLVYYIYHNSLCNPQF